MTLSNIIGGVGGNFLIPLAKLKVLNRQIKLATLKNALYVNDHEEGLKKK